MPPYNKKCANVKVLFWWYTWDHGFWHVFKTQKRWFCKEFCAIGPLGSVDFTDDINFTKI